MLKSETAQTRLKEFEIKDGLELRKAAAQALPRPLQVIISHLIHRDPDPFDDYDDADDDDLTKEESDDATADDAINSPYKSYWQILEETSNRIEALSEQERLTVFEVVFANLASCVETAWQMHAQLPYQFSSERKPFRAPRSPELLRLKRAQWLCHTADITTKYAQDVTWFAAWAPYLGYYADSLGLLFAAAIDTGGRVGEEVFRILTASANGEHEIGAMGRHVTRALLTASRPDGWEFIEKLLLAAQRQEGLRQAILETVDEAHPEAFRRMLRLVLDHDLHRFSAVTRALDVWTGFQFDALTPKLIRTAIEQIYSSLQDANPQHTALTSDDPQAIYLTLWAIAYKDAREAVDVAAQLLQAEQVEKRFTAAVLLRNLDIPEARAALLPQLQDPDLRIVAQAFEAINRSGLLLADTDSFERLEQLVTRLSPQPIITEPLVWPWTDVLLSREIVASGLVRHLGNRSAHRLIPYLSMMHSSGRVDVIRALIANKKTDGFDDITRDALFALVGDSVAWVSETAIDALKRFSPTPQEAARLESLLTRKSAGLRRNVLGLLFNQNDEQALESVDRLLTASKPPLRQAGLEMLQQMHNKGRASQGCQAALERYASSTKKKTDTEQRLLDNLLNPEEALTLANGLGLFDSAQLTPVTPPSVPQLPPSGAFMTAAAANCLAGLNQIMAQYSETPVVIDTYDGKKEMLLGNLEHAFPRPQHDKPLEEDLQRLPLREMWETWWRERPDTLRDTDGFELLRAIGALKWREYLRYCDSSYHYNPTWTKEAWCRSVMERMFKHESLDSLPESMSWPVQFLVEWLLRIAPPSGAADFLLNAVETTFALIPQAELERKVEKDNYRDSDWRDIQQLQGWLYVARLYRNASPADWQPAHDVRLWRLLHWLDRPLPTSKRRTPNLMDVLPAYMEGQASEADILDLLIGDQDSGRYNSSFLALHAISTRKPQPLCVKYPILSELVERCRQRIIEVETRRGDLPTPASEAALKLRYTGGLDTLLRTLPVCGADAFNRMRWTSAVSKMGVLSHLIFRTFPSENETPEIFAQRIREINIEPQKLVDLAVFAPQWSSHVEQTLNWPGLAEGVWWLHAHTKDQQWGVEQEIKDEWTAQVSERTPLSAANLLEGAVDVAWFHRVYETLGEERWTMLDAAAKYASGGTGHTRARLFADAMLGRLTKPQLEARVTEKRNQDSLRALGLLPLADGKAREADVLSRYKLVQEFLRGSKQFGSQRQASEKLAASITMENLARTSGFPDPARLEWAMEAVAIADLAEGPVTVTIAEVTFTLSINPLGEPELTFQKGDKLLRAVPAALKKDPQATALQERKKEIERQGSRMRKSLEQAMCRGDRFAAKEVQELLKHPVLAPMLRSLIFVGEGVAGYPVDGGRALESYNGEATSVSSRTMLRIAHPYDLMQMQEWHAWQRDCFLRERIQPFKQVFRELYVLTPTEKKEGHASRRYEGHQVNPRQSLALLGRCGWVSRPEEGVFRTFHDQNLTAWLTFDQGFTTPAEVEGLTIDGLWFTKKGEGKPLPLEEIPPRVFSEVMRDLDLVVSVAHVGGVDPEASRSTVEMREALVREASALLNLTNVRYQSQHALIDGELGTYSVHLGSAIVHRQPGGHLCIVPVHSQHRGRLFLPFVDDDPKTAEVVSKVLMLAKDTEIKDPTILEQILNTR